MLTETSKKFVKFLMSTLFNLESYEDHCFINEFDENPVVVDLGSNEGNFSKVILNKYPSAKMILVEPNPHLNEKLGLICMGKNAEVLNAAVVSQPNHSIPFYLDSCTANSTVNKEFGKKANGKIINVRSVSLKDLFSIFNIKKIDLLKIDIEGAEWDVLDIFDENDFDRIDQLTIEFHDFKDPSMRGRTEKCIKRLRCLGYSYACWGSNFLYKTPYMNCLFYKKKKLKIKNPLRWIDIHFLQWDFFQIIFQKYFW